MQAEYQSRLRRSFYPVEQEHVRLSMLKHLGEIDPEQVARLRELDAEIAKFPPKPPEQMQEAIRRIRQHFPFMSIEHDEQQRDVLDLLYDGKITEAQAWRMMLRQEQSRCIRDAFDDERCHLAWESYLENARLYFPPRPAQTRLAVHAARKAGILTLYGGSGLGKTTAAIRGIVLRGVDRITRRRAVAVSGMELSRMSAGERSDFVNRVTRTTASLLLDDIDKGGKAEGVSSAILEIIEAREHLDALTLITTNCNGAKLAAKLFTGYGAPIVTRIKRGVLIDFDPQDIDEAECREDLDRKLAIIARQPRSAPRPRKTESCL